MRLGMTLLCAIGACLWFSRPGIAQELVTFEASQPYTADKVELRAELYRPRGEGRFPAVVLMHGCGGWQPAVRYGLQSHARYLQDHGFVVLNLDSFGPRHSGGGKLCASDPDLYRALGYRTADAFDGLRYLQQQDFVAPDNIFLMGQSNGGAVAIRASKNATLKAHKNARPSFRGIVAYYPWCGEFGGTRVSLGAPLLIFAGGKDDWVPARECQGVRSTDASLQVVIYPQAAHSFDLDILPQRFMGKLIGNDPVAAQDSRTRMLAFFNDNLTDGMKRRRGVRQPGIIMAQMEAPADFAP